MKTALTRNLRMMGMALFATNLMALVPSVQAASFDCEKAQSKVERMICGDTELSRLDDELGEAYEDALEGNSNAANVRNAQKQWIKERNRCQEAACLSTLYRQQTIALINATEPATKTLAPFKFGPPLNNSMAAQREVPVCRDFLHYLNHPRSKELFKPDGRLVHESDSIKSVHWERLDKEAYREGFMTVTNVNFLEENLKRYADPEWVLERILAHPLKSRPKSNAPEKWLYRLMPSKPYPRNWSEPKSEAELPVWFPYTSTNWLGDQQGKRHVADVHRMYGGHLQWLEYEGKTHAIDNATSGGGKGATPKYLEVHVYELHVDTESNSILYLTCALRARNNE